ncbi:MAG TPA: DUF92 domain-containing protein [Bryobacteraceae bacterium]|jgi:uncharacterized protein (TIGR00297 family)|nr:DUF92 domain-containing protein [Bryobacteraceae bacterium]
MDDIRLKAFFDACLVEYRSVRDETQSTISDFFKVLQFGSVALLGFMGIGFNFWGKESALVRAIFGLIVPTLSLVCAEILVGEIARIHRASLFCQSVERKLKLAIGDISGILHESVPPPPISWDTWVTGSNAGEDRRYTWMYALSVELIVSISITSIAIYEFYTVRDIHCHHLDRCLLSDVGTSVFILDPIALELAKIALLLKQVKEMAGPYRVAFIPPIKVKNMPMIKEGIAGLFRSGVKTVKWSGIAGAFCEAGLAIFGFGISGAFILLAVSFGGTFASSFHALVGKGQSEPDVQEKNPRTWKNAVANGSVATLLSIWAWSRLQSPPHDITAALFVGSLAAAISDTVSHELGVLFGGTPRSIIGFHVAAVGEDGAVSFWGTLLGVLSSFALAYLAFLVGLLSPSLVIAATLGGVIGNLIDSILGATLQKRGLIGNNVVNFCCTLSGALFTFVIIRILQLS